MPTHVYANNNEIASKACEGKSIAAFPDVCFSPPAPPVGPMPLPYPNTGECTNTDKGTTKVFIKDKMVGMEGDSCFSKSMGDESATQNFTKGMITSALQGKCYFGLWSMDVQMEGKGVPRHLDMVTHNHASMPGQTAGANKDNTTTGSDTKSQETQEIKQSCYKIYLMDSEGYIISSKDFSCAHRQSKVNSRVTKYISRTEESFFDSGSVFHEQSKNITVQLTPNVDAIKNLYYNRYKFDKDTNRNKITQEGGHFPFKVNDYSVAISHMSNKPCNKSGCCGNIEEFKAVIVPSPHFPILMPNTWDLTTAYNLSVISSVAYGGYTKNEKGKFEGSFLDITRNLVVWPEKAKLFGDELKTRNTFFQNNYIFSKIIKFTGVQCYILADCSDIIISFRGTKTLGNYLTDAMCVAIPYLSFGTILSVHSGFYMAYVSIAQRLKEELQKILTKFHNIYVTGHSLGGALGLLCANDFVNISKICQRDKLYLYTYGMPRVLCSSGKFLYNKYIHKKTSLNHFRHTFIGKEGDWVTGMPLCPYFHHGKQIVMQTDAQAGHSLENYIYALKNSERIKRNLNRKYEDEAKRKYAEANYGMDKLRW